MVKDSQIVGRDSLTSLIFFSQNTNSPKTPASIGTNQTKNSTISKMIQSIKHLKTFTCRGSWKARIKTKVKRQVNLIRSKIIISTCLISVVVQKQTKEKGRPIITEMTQTSTTRVPVLKKLHWAKPFIITEWTTNLL